VAGGEGGAADLRDLDVGSGLFALTTIGRRTSSAPSPRASSSRASATGRSSTAALAIAFLAVMLVAALKVVGIIARRLGAGIMQYRLQAAVPPARHPPLPRAAARLAPGPLHRRAAVERQQRRRGDLVPDRAVPLRVGVISMLVTTLGLLFVTDPVSRWSARSSSRRSRS
jgi:hypothetical protein